MGRQTNYYLSNKLLCCLFIDNIKACYPQIPSMRPHHSLPSPPKGNVSCAGRLLHHQLPYHSITASRCSLSQKVYNIYIHMYTTYMYTHVLLQHYAADFSLLHKLKIFIYMSDRPQGTDLTLVFSLSSFSIFFPLPSISVRSFSSPLKPRNPPNSWIRWTVDGGHGKHGRHGPGVHGHCGLRKQVRHAKCTRSHIV